MVVKELTASVHHLSEFFARTSYIAETARAVNSFNSAYGSVSPNYSQAIAAFNQLQQRCISYESQNGFPLDGNPYVELLGISPYVGEGAIANLLELFDSNPAEAEKILGVSQNKLQVAQQITDSLKESLKKLPIHQEATNFYQVREDQVVTRFTHPAKQSAGLGASANDIENIQKILTNIGKLSKSTDAYIFEVMAISQSSPETILVAVGLKLAIPLNFITKTVLKRWREVEEVRNIRAQTEKLQAETEHTKASKDKILKELQSLEDSSASDNKRIAQAVVETYGKDLDGAVNEVEKGIEESIKSLENLIIQGGNVNIYLQPGQLQETNSENWKEELIENRKLQNQVEHSQKLLQQETKKQEE